MSVEEDNEAAEDDDVESLICAGCAEEKDSCHCTKIIEVFSQFNSQLHSLGLMKKVAEPAFLSVIHREVLHALYCACTLHIVEAFRGRSSGWIGWLPPLPSQLWGCLSLKLRKRTKLSPTEVILSQIVPISFYQVSHPPSKILDMAMALWCRGHTALDHWVPEGC